MANNHAQPCSLRRFEELTGTKKAQVFTIRYSGSPQAPNELWEFLRISVSPGSLGYRNS